MESEHSLEEDEIVLCGTLDVDPRDPSNVFDFFEAEDHIEITKE